MGNKGLNLIAEHMRALLGDGNVVEALELASSVDDASTRDTALQLKAQHRVYEREHLAGTGPAVPHARLIAAVTELASRIERKSLIRQYVVPAPAMDEDSRRRIPTGDDLEKIITSPRNLHPTHWMERGIQAARSVCKVVTPKGSGTGFLIGRDLVMTCNHVLPNVEAARRSSAIFNYDEERDGGIRATAVYRFLPDENSFKTDERLDFSLVRVRAEGTGPALHAWGHLDLNATDGVKPGDTVAIVQHPKGGAKRVAIGTNHVVNCWEHRLHYLTDTEPGSSGSPVFNDEWQVVAVHHAGGDMQVSPFGEKRFVNEGVLLSFIRAAAGDLWPSGE